MPRRKSSSVSSAFRRVQQQARGLLADLRKQIRNKQAELKRLLGEEGHLGRMVGRAGANGQAGVAGARGRINWRTVLSQLPRQFGASDVRKIRGLKQKRPSEIFAAITRWIEAGFVKRKARGLYERTK
ncbi:MAG: hypothetical protein ACREQB_01600 [Candidatus Binataceae bacterium]